MPSSADMADAIPKLHRFCGQGGIRALFGTGKKLTEGSWVKLTKNGEVIVTPSSHDAK